MAELIATLKDAGIEARDIQTSGFSVNPNYVYTDARDANGYQLPPKINGYQVFNTVNVRVRELAKLGALLDKAVTVGSNTLNGVSFAVADPSQLYDEARKLAFADARRKAEPVRHRRRRGTGRAAQHQRIPELQPAAPALHDEGSRRLRRRRSPGRRRRAQLPDQRPGHLGPRRLRQAPILPSPRGEGRRSEGQSPVAEARVGG